MLLEIVTVVLALQGADGIDHITTTPYGDYKKYDYGSYELQESVYDNSDDSITNKNTESKPTIKTLSPEEIEEVKRAIQQMLPGHEENSFTQLREVRGADPTPLPYNSYYQHQKLHTQYSNESAVVSKIPKSLTRRSNAHPYYPFYEMYTPQEIWEVVSFEPGKVDTIQQVTSYHTPITTAKTLAETPPDYFESPSTSDATKGVVVEKREADDEEPETPPPEDAVPAEESDKGDEEEPTKPATEPAKDVVSWTETGEEEEIPATAEAKDEEPEKGDAEPEKASTELEETKKSTEGIEEPVKPPTAEHEDEVVKTTKGDTKESVKPFTPGTEVGEEVPEKSDAEDSVISSDENVEMENDKGTGDSTQGTKESGDIETTGKGGGTNVLTDAAGKAISISKTKSTTRRTYRRTTTKFQLDVPMLLQIISNLTYDYEMNLTDNLNETLLKLSIPTCGTPTTTVKAGHFIDYDANATGSIIAKCFVCGLEEEKVPRHAQCADAFAGDFLPLVPVDMTARGKISKYRKYCRYLDVPHYHVNSSMPRSVYGRWSGGCSVRWIDLSGIYTQRSCRNRERAIMGRHYASKRMAKLEMALNNLDDGCISSPMATLVPLSRGISLYARFHACVCTGSWCNHAPSHTHWLPTLAPVLLVQVNALSPVMMS
ncbi:uncharacterized protein [Epargyreus clarus]|uniref:uncharacterized protein n=1 Tax=Epargyreus clarus TaxID=520877 RepID=UPI003C2CAAA0